MATTFAVRMSETERLRKEYQSTLNKMGKKDLIQEFLSYLDYTEESESGNVFHPITIGSCRVLMTEPLGMCLKRMREIIE